LNSFVNGTRSYLQVSTVFGLIVAAVDAGFLWVVGVPLPILWGLLAFITNYIPNIVRHRGGAVGALREDRETCFELRFRTATANPRSSSRAASRGWIIRRVRRT
jgi:hypothetical protein